jgi:proteasome assembly chaperone (PAC2) family protein
LWFDLVKGDAPRLRNPAMVVSVSTSLPQYSALYSQARELANFLLRKVEFKKIATLYSSSLPPEVLVREDGTATLSSCHIYLLKGRNDTLLFAGDSSPMDEQYQFARILLNYADELGVRELISVGARWSESPVSPDSDPEPKGFSTDRQGTERLEKSGVKILAEEPAPFFASMVVGMAKDFGIRGYKLSVDHGEPSPHPRSVARMLSVISELTGLKVSTEELQTKATVHPPIQKNDGESNIYQ